MRCPRCDGYGWEMCTVRFEGLDYQDGDDCSLCIGTGHVSLWQWIIEKVRGERDE